MVSCRITKFMWHQIIEQTSILSSIFFPKTSTLKPYFPFFPYFLFTKRTDTDVSADKSLAWTRENIIIQNTKKRDIDERLFVVTTQIRNSEKEKKERKKERRNGKRTYLLDAIITVDFHDYWSATSLQLLLLYYSSLFVPPLLPYPSLLSLIFSFPPLLFRQISNRNGHMIFLLLKPFSGPDMYVPRSTRNSWALQLAHQLKT